MAQGQGNIMSMVLPFAIFIAIFYFLIIRPQKKREKAHTDMIASITRGSVIVTAGGFFGKVCEVLEDSYIIDLGDETAGQSMKVRVLKNSVAMKKDAGEAAARPKKKRVKKAKPEAEATEQTVAEAAISDVASEPETVAEVSAKDAE